MTGFKLRADVGGEQQEEWHRCFQLFLSLKSVLSVSCSCLVEFAANGCESKAAEKAAG